MELHLTGLKENTMVYNAMRILPSGAEEKTRRIFFFVVLFGILSFAQIAYGEECLRYESEEVSIQGVIVRKTFPGPPEYESIEKGDKPETVWILNLFKPVCVLADKEDDLNETERGVSAIHLVFMEPTKQYEEYRHLVSKKVIATGTLFHSHTGHHRTKVLMEVARIDRMRDNP